MAYVDEVIADNPVGYWRLEEVAGSTTGVNTITNNGQINYANSPTLEVQGALLGETSKAVSLGSGTDHMFVTHSTVLNTVDVFTYEFWIKRSVSSHPTAVERITAKGNASANITLNTNSLIYLFKTGIGLVCHSSIAISDTNWHHIVVAKNGASAKIFIDGIDRTLGFTNQTIEATTTNYFFGQFHDGGGQFLGSIDEIALYNYELPNARIVTHHRVGRTVIQNFNLANSGLLSFVRRFPRGISVSTSSIFSSIRHISKTLNHITPNILNLNRASLFIRDIGISQINSASLFKQLPRFINFNNSSNSQIMGTKVINVLLSFVNNNNFITNKSFTWAKDILTTVNFVFSLKRSISKNFSFPTSSILNLASGRFVPLSIIMNNNSVIFIIRSVRKNISISSFNTLSYIKSINKNLNAVTLNRLLFKVGDSYIVNVLFSSGSSRSLVRHIGKSLKINGVNRLFSPIRGLRGTIKRFTMRIGI